MDINSAFPSKWIRAEDLRGQNVEVTMGHVEAEEVGDEQKPILYFEGKTKGMVLNKTNAGAITSMYGPDTDRWAGKKITIFPTQCDYAGKITPCIRVRLMTSRKPATIAAPEPESDPETSIDDIPF